MEITKDNYDQIEPTVINDIHNVYIYINKIG